MEAMRAEKHLRGRLPHVRLEQRDAQRGEPLHHGPAPARERLAADAKRERVGMRPNALARGSMTHNAASRCITGQHTRASASLPMPFAT